MNNNLKVLLGTLVGAGLGYFVGQVIVEIIAIKENQVDYHDTEEFPHDGEDMEEETEGEPEVMNKNALKTKRVKNYTQYFKNQNRPDLAALAAKYNGKELVDETKEDALLVTDTIDLTEEIEYSVEDEAKQTDPSIISMSEFANAGDEYECLTLNYYDDDVVTDENDEPISRPEQILGEEALVSFGEQSGDEDVVYVRNEKKKAMYEVVRTNKEYAAPKSRRRGKEHIDYDKEESNGEDNVT